MLLKENINFRKLFYFNLLFKAFNGAAITLFPLLALNVFDSVVISAASKTFEYVPYILFAVAVGVIIDIYNRRTLELYLVIVLTVFLGIVSLSIYFNTLWMFFVGCVGAYVCLYSIGQVETALMKSLVAKEDLVHANAYMKVYSNVVFVAVPLFILTLSTMLGSFSAIFVLTVLTILSIPILNSISDRDATLDKKSKSTSIREGFTYLFSDKSLLFFTLLISVVNGFMGLVFFLQIIHVKEVFGLSDSYVGLMVSVSTIASIFGGFVVAKTVKTANIHSMFILSTVAMAVVFGLFLFVKTYNLFLILISMQGFFLSMHIVSVSTYRQAIVDNEIFGRVQALTSMFYKIVVVIVVAVSPLLIGQFSVSNLYFYCMLGILISLSIYFTLNRRQLVAI